MSKNNGHGYLLWDGAAELDRLQFQHGVLGPVTDQFFNCIGVEHGWRSLDVGADWQAHRQNPDTIFVSPFVIDIAAKT